MQVWGLTAAEVRAVVASVSADKYAGNLTFGRSFGVGLRDESGARVGAKARFTLGVHSSKGEGARRSAPTPWRNGRRLVAASWQAHYDVMLALFDAGATRIKSSMADYRGAPHYSLLRSEGYSLADMGQMRKAGPYPTGRDAFLAIADRTYDINAGSVMAPSAFGDL
jgi:hypothetical protein